MKSLLTPDTDSQEGKDEHKEDKEADNVSTASIIDRSSVGHRLISDSLTN